MPRRPEVLAPAGDEASLLAAIQAGADAVYFGVHGFNARARAANFGASDLPRILDLLHAHGVKGYVTLNTLVFDDELERLEEVVRACATAGVDAVIVQDLGVVAMVRAIAPSMPVHASTQMTCTDASSASLAAQLGATRVILSRETSLEEMAAIKRGTDVELEVFVHGALCISYSGQCLTSEAVGGRSANRGACAQACRLPYDLVVDGELRELGDRKHLLSPQDLETSAHVGTLVEMGISSLKIEGRLKGPEYVAATTKLYRGAIDEAFGDPLPPGARDLALQTYSRGSGPGFFEGVNHQRLVDGVGCEHRGLEIGALLGTTKRGDKTFLRVALSRAVARGDGLVVEARAGAPEIGGRIWAIEAKGRDETSASGGEALIWLGPDVEVPRHDVERRVFRTSDPAAAAKIRESIDRDPHRVALDLVLRGRMGEPFELEGRSARGAFATVVGDSKIDAARNQPLTADKAREALSRLGDTPFALGTLEIALPEGAIVPISSLNRARRALVDELTAHTTSHTTQAVSIASLSATPRRVPPPGGLFVLCRTIEQARAAHEAGADGIYLDFLELTGLGSALRVLREDGATCVGVAPPRVRKPGEERIDRYLATLDPDLLLVRSLGSLFDLPRERRALVVGDFSLNVANRITAARFLELGLDAFTPSFDLDGKQLRAFLSRELAPMAEVVLHHPMPLFYMEHCLYAALLSEGRDYKSCGRPCDRHQISLRDRTGREHPVIADVGCRNTVFHGASQSAASLALSLRDAGAKRFRVELVREDRARVLEIVGAYRALLRGERTPTDVYRGLRTEDGYGVVRGSLRVLSA